MLSGVIAPQGRCLRFTVGRGAPDRSRGAEGGSAGATGLLARGFKVHWSVFECWKKKSVSGQCERVREAKELQLVMQVSPIVRLLIV